MSQLTHEERLQNLTDYLEASKSGDYEKAHRIAQQKPLTPWIAKGIKEVFGTEYLEGWDLSEAEAEYGKDWLNK